MSESKSDLFFPADSDDEDETFLISSHAPANAPSSSAARTIGSSSSAVSKEALFTAADDDDDDDGIMVVNSESSAGPSRRSSPASSVKRRLPSSQAGPSSVRADFTRGYLGEFVCEGWSLSKGKGYASPGSRIFFERPKAAKAASSDAGEGKGGPARLVNGKVVHAKPKTGGKQMSLSSMMTKKAVPSVSLSHGQANVQISKKAAAKKVDQIIRFRNERGFGMFKDCEFS